MATSRTREGAEMNTGEEIQQQAQQPLRQLSFIGNIRQFLHDVSLEMKKVSWPSRTEVVNTTIIVIIAVFFFAFYLFATDIVFSYVIQGLEWAAVKVFG
ncbi:MAG: preprotein translocase subunit SecE [Blastocatellales bacterium]|nr:preprotein translocase subunit SecE [Blastocatellales bacterium]